MPNPLQQSLDYYDIFLIYHPNTFFVASPVILIMLGYWLIRCIRDVLLFAQYIATTKPAKLQFRYRRIHVLYLRIIKQYSFFVKKIANEILLPEEGV